MSRVSIHAPLAGSDWRVRASNSAQNRFNPRSPRGERPEPKPLRRVLRMFQSTLPSRGAARISITKSLNCSVSIHAPLAGSDQGRGYIVSIMGKFQSTLPSRGATSGKFTHARAKMFQSTLPSRGATGVFHRWGL